jgi:epoxyqueuosine reductase QueG
MSLNSLIEDFLLKRGVLKVGFVTLESIAGGPPSADLTYILSQAQSAISFALPLDRDKIRSYLSKQNQGDHEMDNINANIR